MSRQDEIFEASQYLGLSAGHFAAWGAKWHETGHYGDRFQDKLADMSLNLTERTTLRDTAIKRAATYLAKSAREGKIEAAELPKRLEIAKEEVDRRIAELAER